MAIPLYVPDEYGPLPTNSTNQQQQPQHQCSSVETQSFMSHRKSFLQQLILELCSIHQQFCTSVDQSANPTATADVNNNARVGSQPHSHSQRNCPPSSRSRRRRHPAGKNGFPDLETCHDNLMVPLTALAENARNGHEEKRVSEDHLSNLGFQLRQIADSYAASKVCDKCLDKENDQATASNSSSPSARRSPTGHTARRWSTRFAYASLFAIVTVSVSFVVARQK